MATAEEELSSSSQEDGQDDETSEMEIENHREESERTGNNNLNETMAKRKAPEPSPIWTNNCGTSTKDGSTCAFCGKFYKSSGSSTTNLGNHLKRYHRDKPEVQQYIKDAKAKVERKKMKSASKRKREDESRPPSVMNYVNRQTSINPAKKMKLDEAIAKWIAADHKSFSEPESHAFRELLFIAEPGYVCPSADKATRDFDKLAVKLKENLKEEITKDVTEAGHKSGCVVSDHGTTKDRFRTKKNAITFSRITKNFYLKTDTVALVKCEGPQTGNVIRKDVKSELVKVGWEPSWNIDWVTDNEAKQISARGPGRHPEVGLDTNLTGKQLMKTCFVTCYF